MLYPWQHSQWQQITGQIAKQRLAHAMLLAAPAGMGKRVFAQTLAEYLLCENPQQFACGQCRSCLWLRAGTHPDLFVIAPEEEGKAIKIEQIRTLIAAVSQTAQHMRQVIILQPAEAMNRATANALLKTLEEPPGNCVFLLISDQLMALPATVRSRCQIIKFPLPDTASTLAWLQERPRDQVAGIQGEVAGIRLALALAQGVPLLAVKFLAEENLKQHQEVAKHFVQLYRQQLQPLVMAQTCSKLNFDAVFLSLWLLLSDLIKLKLHGQAQSIIHQTLSTELIAIRQKVSLESLYLALSKLLELKAIMQQKINLNSQLMWEDFFIEVIQC